MGMIETDESLSAKPLAVVSGADGVSEAWGLTMRVREALQNAGAARTAKEPTSLMWVRSRSWEETVRICSCYVGLLDSEEACDWDMSDAAQRERQGNHRVWTMGPKSGDGGWVDFVKNGGSLSERNGQGRAWMWGLSFKNKGDPSKRADWLAGAAEQTDDFAGCDNLGQTFLHRNTNIEALAALLGLAEKTGSLAAMASTEDMLGCTAAGAQLLNHTGAFPSPGKFWETAEVFLRTGGSFPIRTGKGHESVMAWLLAADGDKVPDRRTTERNLAALCMMAEAAKGDVDDGVAKIAGEAAALPGVRREIGFLELSVCSSPGKGAKKNARL